MKIGVVGLGLIGGSIAKAIKSHTEHTVFGYNRTKSVMYAALEDGTIDGILEDANIGQCSYLIIALYPDQIVEFLKEKSPLISRTTIVFDCGGTKEKVCKAGFALAEQYGYTFIGGHPMAGIEKSGYDYSTGEMFRGASMIFVPKENEKTDIIEAATKFVYSLGFGMVKLTTYAEHDRVIAYTSQLAHVVSSAYIQSPTALQYVGFSAGSFRDMTRVAFLNEGMWSELFLLNRESLLNQMQLFKNEFNKLEEYLRNGDREGMMEMMKLSTERRKRFDK
jgi:prephenate dehydrogenase